jgi:hypothetical protein
MFSRSSSPVTEFNKHLVWQVRRMVAKLEGLSVMDISWKRAMFLAQYIQDKRLDGKQLAYSIYWAKRNERDHLHYRLDKRLDKIFSTTYKGRAKKLDNENQPADWLMV